MGVPEACRWVCWRHAGGCAGGMQVGVPEACRWVCQRRAGRCAEGVQVGVPEACRWGQLAPTTSIKYKITKMQCNCVSACCENRHDFCVALCTGGKCVTATFIAFSPPVSRKLRNAASDGSYEEGV